MLNKTTVSISTCLIDQQIRSKRIEPKMTNWSITVKTVGSADTSGSATASAVAEASILNRSNHVKTIGFENSKLDQKVQGDGAAQQLCKEPSPSTFTVQLDNESPLSELHSY